MPRIRIPGDKYDAGLTKALKAAGGPTALARKLGLVPSAVTQWRRIPAERAHAISAMTELPLHELRPDLWSKDVAA